MYKCILVINTNCYMSLKIGEVAKQLNVTIKTVRRWEAEGKITPQRVGNHRVYSLEDVENMRNFKRNRKHAFIIRKNVIYARINPNDDEQLLQKQVQFMQQLFPDYETITDTSSSLDFNRPGLQSLLERICKAEIGRIAVACPDRIGRSGQELFEEIAKIFGCEIVFVNNFETSPKSELVRDVIEFTKSASGRVNDLCKYADEMSNDKTLQQE